MDEEKKYSVLISLRLHKDLVTQIDTLAETLASMPDITPSGITNRSETIRALIVIGMGEVMKRKENR